ncbi:MAG TPA: amidohydrolase family protein [Bacillota bacterium]
MQGKLYAHRLFDGRSQAYREQVVVLFDEQGTVVDIRPASRKDADALLSDQALYILPGLVDAHDHLTIDFGDGVEARSLTREQKLLRAVRRAREYLAAGITLLRSPGEHYGLGQVIKDALRRGWIEGPALYAAGEPLAMTGGHGWYISCEVDGVEALRAAIRRQVKSGCDFIKLIASGGVTAEGSELARSEFTRDELWAAVDEAHRRGRPVTAHVYGGEALDWLIDAGIDAVEHASFAAPEQLRRMAEGGVTMVVTASVMIAGGRAGHIRPFMREKFAQAAAVYKETVSRAFQAGVAMVAGCDTHHCHLGDEVAFLMDAGLPPFTALQAITDGPAGLMGLRDRHGWLGPGSRADMIVLRDDPTQDPTVINDPLMVLQGGRVVAPAPGPAGGGGSRA